MRMPSFVFAVILVLGFAMQLPSHGNPPATLPMAAAPVTVSEIDIINADTLANAGKLIPGGTLYLSQLPPHVTLQVQFSGKIGKASFWFDNLPEVQQWSAPYFVGNKNPYHPLPFTLGPHKLLWSVDSQANQAINFNLAAAPPAPATQAVFGWNWYSVSAPAMTVPGTPPQIARLAADTSAPWVRVWLEYNTFNASPAHYFDRCDDLRKAGCRIFFQLQYCDVGYRAFTPAQYAQIGRACIGHVDALSMGNEVGSSGYFKGSQADLVAGQLVLGPIIRPAILLIGPSYLNDAGMTHARAYAALPGGVSCDGYDTHLYTTHASDIVAGSAAFVPWCNSLGKSAWISEEGTRPYQDGNQPAATFSSTAWMADQMAMITAQQSQGATFMIYSAMYQLDGHDYAVPLSGTLGKTAYYAGYQAVMFRAPATQPATQPVN